MCGDDRVDNYSTIIDQYDEIETQYQSNDKILNILKGKLKCNIGNGRTKGISGTEVRKSILNNDKEMFEKIMPHNVDMIFDSFIQAFHNFRDQLKSV